MRSEPEARPGAERLCPPRPQTRKSLRCLPLGVKFRFYYSGIRVRNLKRSLDFYTKAIGLKKVAGGTMPHGGKWVHLKDTSSKQVLELNWYPRGSRFYTQYAPGEELDHLAFVVKDVEKAYRLLLDAGATPAVAPADSKGTEVYVKDPDGIWIELLQAK